MSDTVTATAPTSSATTKDTEPGVVAAISSGEGRGKLSFSTGSGFAAGLARPLLLLTGAVMLGYAADRWLRRR